MFEYGVVSVPVIVLICYLMAEAIKVLFYKNSKVRELLPIISAFIGCVLAIIIFVFVPDLRLFNNVLDAIVVGIISGLGATGSNQIFKQIKKLIENSNTSEDNKELDEVTYNPDEYLEIGGRCEICITRNCPQCPHLTKDEGGD